jgi:hypothetical protein
MLKLLFNFLFSTLLQLVGLRKPPTFITAQYISDNYGRRILFTVFSNNSNGTIIGKKRLKVEEIRENNSGKNIIHLNFMKNEDFLNSQYNPDDIPKWTFKGQQSFVAGLSDTQLLKTAAYKITFYTYDGSCSFTLSKNYYGPLAKLFNDKPD